MSEHSIYKDIAERTAGDIYIGVVGPVRTGKSTFIKRFMESLVLPNISTGYSKDRTRDELPQSAAGKTVMTTEPKFIPNEAVSVTIDNTTQFKLRMIDCVGYIVPDAIGISENGEPRMVRTPWHDEPVPFSEAAEQGTSKVINEHSTIGILVTTDGTIGDIGRENYVEAEERVVNELKALHKPFAIVLNSADPTSDVAKKLAYELEDKYGIPIALVSCLDLDAEDITHILELVLHEFPVTEIKIRLPEWTVALPDDHRVKKAMTESIRACAGKVNKIGDINDAFSTMKDNEYVKDAVVSEIDMGQGSAVVDVTFTDGLYFNIVSELTGLDVTSESDLINLLKNFAEIKTRYERVGKAIQDAEENGYGIVMPDVSELHLEKPEIVKQPGGYGVKLRASAQSVHMIRANIETEISPIVGTEQQSEDMVKYMLNEFEEMPEKIWESNMFGKSLYEMVNDGLRTKLEHIPDESRIKLSETLERIINEGSNGLICIIV